MIFHIFFLRVGDIDVYIFYITGENLSSWCFLSRFLISTPAGSSTGIIIQIGRPSENWKKFFKGVWFDCVSLNSLRDSTNTRVVDISAAGYASWLLVSRSIGFEFDEGTGVNFGLSGGLRVYVFEEIGAIAFIFFAFSDFFHIVNCSNR